MGKVPICAQWLMIATGVLLSPVYVPFVAWFIGWSRLCRLWTRRQVAPRTSWAGWGRSPGVKF
jgi:hypothetical protein